LEIDTEVGEIEKLDNPDSDLDSLNLNDIDSEKLPLKH